jgi:hypothetical protein
VNANALHDTQGVRRGGRRVRHAGADAADALLDAVQPLCLKGLHDTGSPLHAERLGIAHGAAHGTAQSVWASLTACRVLP